MTDDTVLEFVTLYMTATGNGDIDAIAGLFAPRCGLLSATRRRENTAARNGVAAVAVTG